MNTKQLIVLVLLLLALLIGPSLFYGLFSLFYRLNWLLTSSEEFASILTIVLSVGTFMLGLSIFIFNCVENKLATRLWSWFKELR